MLDYNYTIQLDLPVQTPTCSESSWELLLRSVAACQPLGKTGRCKRFTSLFLVLLCLQEVRGSVPVQMVGTTSAIITVKYGKLSKKEIKLVSYNYIRKEQINY